jgi:hypothetical protein
MLALLPAWAGARVITCQATPTYAGMPLQTACLVRAAHQHGVQDINRSTTLRQLNHHLGHRKA